MISFILGGLLAILLFGVFIALGSLIVALFSDATILSVRIFGKAGKKMVSAENLQWHNDRFTLLPEILLTIPMDNNYDENIKKINLFSNVVVGLFSSIYAFIVLYFLWGNPTFFPRIIRYSAYVIIVQLIILLIKTANYVLAQKNSLNRFVVERVNELKSGATFDQINMSVQNDIIEKSDRQNKVLYYHLCFMKALWTKNYSALNNLVRQLDVSLRSHGEKSEYAYTTMTVMGYYDIVFYSSYINQNINHALKVYSFVKQSLDSDMDANGRRVLAYYQFYVLKQPQAASITLNQAIEALHKSDMTILTQAEYDLEKRLIEELQNNMTRILNPNTEPRPIIENTLDDSTYI